MEASKNGLDRIVNAVDKLKDLQDRNPSGTLHDGEKELKIQAQALVAKYEEAMDDDFNTADAISAVFELVKLSNSTAEQGSSAEYVDFLKNTICELCDVLGLIAEKKAEILDSEIEAMIEARQQARKNKDFAMADQIRGELLEKGIVLEDSREGVKWKRA